MYLVCNVVFSFRSWLIDSSLLAPQVHFLFLQTFYFSAVSPLVVRSLFPLFFLDFVWLLSLKMSGVPAKRPVSPIPRPESSQSKYPKLEPSSSSSVSDTDPPEIPQCDLA